MRFRELSEGGWASTLTQNTKITPLLVASVVIALERFEKELNKYLETQNMPPFEMGNPAGSTTYWQRDLKQNPSREYGDIDVNIFIPQLEGMTPNANAQQYRDAIIEFCKTSTTFKTDNGNNIIVKLGEDYVQVDLIIAFSHNKEWTRALAPAYNVKGVLCNSLYSSMAEALNLSMGGGHGVQVKLQNGKPVPFKTMKNVELVTITNNPHTWAADILRFFGGQKVAPLLRDNPGMKDEVRVEDIVNSIKGLAQSLELNGFYNAKTLLHNIAEIYRGKIQKAIDSSKYDKAATQMAILKAKQTKEMLASKMEPIASMLES